MESAYGREVYANYAAARARRDIMELLENPMWDDGSLAPVVVRTVELSLKVLYRTAGEKSATMYHGTPLSMNVFLRNFTMTVYNSVITRPQNC